MYTQHSDGGDDLFVCDVCEAILVSEQGIVEHLRTKHREELLVMDVETIRQETEARSSETEPSEDQNSETSQTSEDSGYEGAAEGARAPKIDMTFVERQFYVCCHCDDVFLDKKHLQVHINISHDLSEKENDRPDASTIDSPPQSPKPKRFKKRVIEDDSMKAREVSRVGISQTQTPRNNMAPPLPVTNTLLTDSNAKLAVCLPDEVDKGIDVSGSNDNTANVTMSNLVRTNDKLPEKKKNEATSQGADNTNDVRLSKDNTDKETISKNLVTSNEKHSGKKNNNKANILKALNTTELSNRPTRSSRKATPRFSMEVEVTEADVGCKSSPRKETTSEKNDVNEQVEDTETIDVPIQYKLSESVGRKPRRSKESSPRQAQHSPCVGVGNFYGSTLSSTSPGSIKRPKTPSIPSTDNNLDPSPMKVSKSLPKKRKLKSPHKDKSSLPASDKDLEPCDIKKSKSLKVTSEVAMEYQCPHCGDCKDKKENFKNHFLSHYYDCFTSVLPSSPPYACPEADCKNVSRDKITLLRHYAFTHKKMFTMTDVTEDKLKEIMAKALVPKE